MNKLLKTTGIFILGIGLMTGCADKVTQKIDNNNNNATSEVTTTEETPTSLANLQKEVEHIKQANTNVNANIINNKPTPQPTTPTRKNTIIQQTTQTRKHDLAKAGEILQPMSYGMLNLQGSSTANVVRFITSNDGSNNVVKQMNMTKVLDLLNTYNAQTFHKHDVLQKLQNDKEIEFVQLNNKVTDFSKQNLEKLMNHKNKVVYLAKDEVFLAKSDIGYGGPTDTIFIPVEKWEIQGDKVLIPFENIATRKPIGMMTLRLNNKIYESGIDKTMYYIEKFEIY